MTTRTVKANQPRWHVPALAFFATGFMAGLALVTLATIPGIRGMGVIALASSILGMVMVGYALRMEDPATWAVITGRFKLKSLGAATASSWTNLRARRRTFDRYLQGVAWTGMR